MIEVQKDLEYQSIIGIDEVGRGPLAGPVVACAFLLRGVAKLPQEITDSKKISKNKREKFSKFLTANFDYAIGIKSNDEVDEINILQATYSAMRDAYNDLEQKIDLKETPSPIILIDGRDNPLKSAKIPSQSIIKGDSKSYAIASASIIAKVFRDRLMAELAIKHPQYGWERNAGYGTKEHIEAILKYGLTPYHRHSFVANILKQHNDK